ncbi:hypothetical protein AURDEDRAFT_172389 [Auricularia subglabra TFB-10046 SS5]|nr:hypothetical protein AURDEDRAFT_172389 [Auricularia subglabra TFB-10046 SS5]
MVSSALASRLDPAAALPLELVFKCIESFFFDDVRPLLAVSARWRAIALDSEAYWSFIHLKWFTAGAVDLFFTRLARTGTRPVSLTIELRPPKPELVRLQDAILSAVRDHIHHLNWLLFYFRASDASKLWSALAGAAPELRHFDLRVDKVPITDPLPVIPAELFAGQAPRLRTVAIEDVALPPRPLTIFSQVTKLCIQYSVTRPMEDFFPHFPRVTEANFPAWSSFGNPVFARSGFYRHINEWIWISGRAVHNVPFPLAVVQDIEMVRVYNPLPLSGLIAQLIPPLSFTFAPDLRCPEEEFNLSVTGQSSTNRPWRVFIDEYRFWTPPMGPDIRQALHAALAGKVYTLFFGAPVWPSLVRCVPPVPGLRYLRIFAEAQDDFSALTPAAFPSRDLRKLELNSQAGCVTLKQASILKFVMGSFDAAAMLRGTLALVDVHVIGDPGGFTGVFGDVRFSHSGPCGYPPLRRRLYYAPG